MDLNLFFKLVTFTLYDPADFHKQKRTCEPDILSRMRCSMISKFLTFCNKFDELIWLGTHLIVKVPRPGDSEGTFSVFESSCSKVEAIPLSAFPKDTTSELAGLSPH